MILLVIAHYLRQIFAEDIHLHTAAPAINERTKLNA